MQFKPLKVFCDVARSRSFSQAALINQVTQSAVSQMVAMLEKEMAVQLIDRSTRPLQLTALGKKYYEGCKSILEQHQELVASLKAAHARVEGTVQIAAIYSVGLGDMGQLVNQFMNQQPDAEVHIEYLHPNQVYEKVLEGAADIGLLSFPRKSSKLTIVQWREEPMVVVCAPKHPLAGEKAISVTRLDGLRYIHFSKELVIRREVDRFFRTKKVSVDVIHEFDNIENIKKAVEYSTGVALLPQPTFQAEIDHNDLIAIPLSDSKFVRPLGIIYRRHQKLSHASQGFLELLQSEKKASSSSNPPVGKSKTNGVHVGDSTANGKARSGVGAKERELETKRRDGLDPDPSTNAENGSGPSRKSKSKKR
ncbi:MAG: LysR family transcriptional regulator [Gemmataceae bacterium]